MFQEIDKPNGEFSQRNDIKIMKIKWNRNSRNEKYSNKN